MPIGIWPVVGTQLDWVCLEPEAGGLLDSCSNEVVSTICLVGASSCNGSQTSIGGCWFLEILSPLPAPVPLLAPCPLPGKCPWEIVVMDLSLPL